MNISDFQANRFTFEIRFPEAYLFWDRAGTITKALEKEFPGLEVVEGTPAKVSLIVRPNIELILELNKAFVIVHNPKRTGEDLISCGEILTKNVTDALGLLSFKRIGTRLFYQKSFGSIEEATLKMLSMGGVNLPEGKFFNQQGAPKQGSYNFSWEGETTGARVRFATETENFEFNPSPPHIRRIDPVKKTEYLLYIDIDVFSTKEILREQLKVDDWIKNVIHMTNRDLKQFMGST